MGVSYEYTAEGRRSKKTVNGTETRYVWDGERLLSETKGNETIYYLYHGSSLVGLEYKGSEYYYEYNLQGDVAGIVNSSGQNVVRYTYSAWGKPESCTGNTELGEANPIRYRGYYYDAETGFYYLLSRYYDPDVGRFLNTDGYLSGVGGDVRGYNLYSDCFNNPVNMSDPSGSWPSWSQIFTGIAIAAVAVAAVAAVVATAGAVAPALAAAGGGIIGGISAGAAATAAIVATGAMVVAGVSATAAVVTSVVENTSYRGPTRDQTVYKLVDDKGETKYVGRTNNPTRRANEHKKSPGKSNLEMVKIESGLTKIEARAMEQIVISAYTLDNLTNARREIAVGNVSGFAGKIGNVISIFGGAVEDEFLNLMGR